MTERIEAFDWSQTALGPRDEWPASLKTTVGMLLASPTPIALYWGSELIVFYNDAWSEIVGAKHPKALGSTYQDVFPEIWETVGPMFDKVLSGSGSVVEREFPFIMERYGEPDECWFDFTLSPVPNEEGGIGGVLNLAAEVTEKVKADLALRESEERYQTLFNSVSEGFGLLEILYDAKGKPIDFCILKCNPAFERQSGIPQAAGKRGTEVIPNLEQKWIEAYSKVAQSGKSDEIVDYVSGLGRWFYVRVFAARPEEQKVVVLFTDITEQRKTQERLRESEAEQIRQRRFLETLLDNAEVCIAVLTGKDLRYTLVNRAYQRLQPGTEMLGKTYREVFPSVVEAGAEAAMLKVMQTGKSHEDYACAIPVPGKPDAEWDHRIALLPANGDDEPAVLLMTWDVTERARAMRALKEADQRKNEFLATLAHELRNPLTPILGGLELLMETGPDPARAQRIFDTMERQTRQLNVLVEDLLDVSRISRGKLKLRKTRIDLADVITSAVESTQSQIDAARHELKVELPEEPVYLHADPNRLVQVFSNLLNNAAKYTPDKGQLSLVASRTQAGVEVAVTDSGIGIPAEMLERVFEMFLQLEQPQERVAAGLGIGLTLAKSLVEMHGGEISVQSEGVDQGTTFAVQLPAKVLEEKPPEKLPEQTPAKATTRKPRVLVVDDNKDAASIVRMLVDSMGAETKMAHDGLAAIDAAKAWQPDLVLMDLGMPRLNGFDAARRMRNEPWGKKFKLVALTGWGQELDRQKTREVGFDLHLVKPPRSADLERLVNQVRAHLIH